MITNCYTAGAAAAYHAAVRIIAFLLLVAFTSGSALAQPAWKRDAREMLEAALNSYGAEVITAAGALKALDTLASEKIDVLVSDINMPEVDGYELIRRVRAMKPEQGGRIPAVALTAYARAEDRMRALKSGYQTHMPKPVEPAELEVVVATLAKSFKGGD